MKETKKTRIERELGYLGKYLSTAPVIATLWLSLTASLIIEINRFFPDSLVF